jgi:hypothetical protein
MNATSLPAGADADGARAELDPTHPPDRRLWIVVGLAAAAMDVAGRRGPGLATVAFVVLVAGGLVGSGRMVNRRALPLVLATVPFAVFFAVRTAPGLLTLDLLAGASLLVLAASYAQEGDPTDLTVPGLVARGAHGLAHLAAAPAFALRRPPGGEGRDDRSGPPIPALARGALLAAPVVVVIGLLLGSADPVFASFFRMPADPGDLAGHVLLSGVGAWVVVGLARAASAPFKSIGTAPHRLGFVEAVTVLASLVVLYAAFAVAQVVALTGGAEHVVRTAGLTYAEYARSGFFQLIAVATITLGVLLALRATADLSSPSRQRWFLVLAEGAVALTVVIVAVALRRLHLYEQAYGLTLLRLFSAAFALWVGAVFVVLACVLAGVGRARSWLVPAAVALAAAGLLLLNGANPDAVVVNRNVARFERSGRIDTSYVSSLSDDAVPALVAALPRLDPASREVVRDRLCAGPVRPSDVLSYNRSKVEAEQVRRRLCGAASP